MGLKKILTGRFLLTILLAFAFVCNANGEQSRAVAQETTDRLIVIGTGDLQGRLDPAPRTTRLTESGEKIEVVGGISRIATLIQQIKKESSDPVLVLSSGDDLMGAYFHLFAGKAIFSLMEKSGYTVLAPDLVKHVSKQPNFLDTFQSGFSPTSTTNHFPVGSRAPRDVNLRQSCSWAARRLGCCNGSRRTMTSFVLDFIQPWQLVTKVSSVQLSVISYQSRCGEVG